MDNFQCFALPEALLRSLEGMKYTTPTPIQAQAIPLALEGKDVLGSAQTGTGKTAAFAIPLIAYIMAAPENTALVMTPTRELAVQVTGIVRQLLAGQKVQAALLIGGQPMRPQLEQLRSRPRIIIGTPGRINDHLQRRTVNLSNTGFVVLDETDRMLDMGFGIQIDTILQYAPKQRQTLMFSATLPKEIMKLSAKYLNNPVRVAVGDLNKPVVNIRQDVAHVSDAEKHARLIKELEERQGSIIIFVKTKRGADRLAEKLRKQEHSAQAIHGDLRQGQRDRVIREFRAEKYRILVATDVAARGLDIPHVRHVINYDLPTSPSDYVHRIGRTARAGEEGSALCLVSPEDNSKWRAISKMLSTGEVSADENGRGGSSRSSGGNRERDYSRPRRGNDRKPFGDRGSNSGFGRRSEGGQKPYRNDDRKSFSNFEGRKFKRDGENNEENNSSSGNSESGRSFFRKDSRNNERRPSEGNFEGRKFSRDGNRSERRPAESNFEGRRFPRDGERNDRRPAEGNSEGRRFSRDGERNDRRPIEGNSEGRRFSRDGERNDRRSSESSNASGRHFFRKDSDRKPSDGNFEGRRFPRDGERSERRPVEGNSEGRSFFRKDGGKPGNPRKGGFSGRPGQNRKAASNY